MEYQKHVLLLLNNAVLICCLKKETGSMKTVLSQKTNGFRNSFAPNYKTFISNYSTKPSSLKEIALNTTVEPSWNTSISNYKTTMPSYTTISSTSEIKTDSSKISDITPTSLVTALRVTKKSCAIKTDDYIYLTVQYITRKDVDPSNVNLTLEDIDYDDTLTGKVTYLNQCTYSIGVNASEITCKTKKINELWSFKVSLVYKSYSAIVENEMRPVFYYADCKVESTFNMKMMNRTHSSLTVEITLSRVLAIFLHSVELSTYDFVSKISEEECERNTANNYSCKAANLTQCKQYNLCVKIKISYTQTTTQCMKTSTPGCAVVIISPQSNVVKLSNIYLVVGLVLVVIALVLSVGVAIWIKKPWRFTPAVVTEEKSISYERFRNEDLVIFSESKLS